MTTTTKQDRHKTSQGVCPLVRWRLSLLLLLLMAVGVQRTWAVDDTFTVNSGTSTARGSTIYTGTYTSLTLGFSSDAGGTPNVFQLTNGDKTIGGDRNPHFNGSSVPDGGHVFVLTTSQPGDFVFHVKLNKDKTMSLRNSSGVDVATKANSSASSKDFEWKVTVETEGTYYLFARGSKLELFGYTFTKKPIQGITQLPYSADFSSDTEPFDGGERASGTNVSNVFRVQNRTATATFQGGHTLKGTEVVNISFTAYHGYLNNGGGVTVTLYNTANEPLISYHYHQPTQNITDVSFGGETVAGFVAFPGASFFAKDGSGNNRWANGLTEATKPYQVGSGTYNPLITMTVSGSGQVTFSLKTSEAGINRSFSEVISDRVVDLGKIVIVDANNNADRCFAMDDLSVTSQLYSYDYENTGGLTDWTTSAGGRYTPIIAEDALTGNHYMTVNQDQRNNNGTTLTNNAINGSASAGESFTLEFDMKIGRGTENGNSSQPDANFTIFDAAGASLFSMTDKRTTTDSKADWYLKAAENTQEAYDGVAGTGSNQPIASLTWYHYKLSYTGGRLYVTITSQDGSTTYWRKGYTTTSSGGLSKMAFVTSRYNANFAFDNLKVSAYANTNFSVSGKTETYTINSAGDLPQVNEGKTISIEYGVAEQVQMTTTEGTIGAYCLDANVEGKFSQAYSAESPTSTSIPDRGTYYKFIPKFAGKLSISGWVNDGSGHVNNVTLQKVSDGSIIATYLPDNSAVFSNQLLDVELEAGKSYYLYASTPNTANSTTTYYPTFFLTGFKFEQSSMNREIKVSDLLYSGSTDATDGKLNREIPGFQLSYSGDAKVQTTANGQGLTISNGGSITIKLRENGYDAKINNITLNVSEVSSATVNSESITETGKHSFTISPAATATLSCTVGSLTITSLSVGYTGDDNNNTAMWLDDEKTITPTLTFDDSHLMRIAGDGKAFTQVPAVSPASFNAVLTYSSSNTSIATINPDGSNGQLLRNGQATITATFAETDYYNSATATYTVDNVLQNGESYSCGANNNDVVRVNALAAAADKELTLTGTNDASMTFGTTSSDLRTTANATTVTLTNNSGSDITIERLRIYAKNLKAYLYYEGQEENYAEQLVFKDFPSGPVKGFRVLDIGDPTAPIDLTSAYSLKSGEYYVWTDGTLVTSTHHGGTFNTGNGGFTVSSKDSGVETTLPKVSHALTKTGKADGYANELTAEANIFVAIPTDIDIYKTWDMTTAVSAAGQMDATWWTWNGHGYYQAYLPEYLPILNNGRTTLAGNEGLLARGDLRYYTGTTGLRMNLTRVNSRLKFPVKAGMEVKIEMASASADIEHLISNVTDLFGNAVSTVYIENAGPEAPITAYFLAAADGAVELRSMDKLGAYVKRITLQVPQIHFNEEIVTVKNEAATITNVPYNTGDATLTYSIKAGSSYNLNNETKADDYIATVPTPSVGKVNVTGEEGYVTVEVTNSSATGVQPKKGSYKIYVIDFRFDQASYNSTYDGSDGGEAVFNQLPTGYNKVVQPVNYTMEYVSGEPRGRLTQKTNQDPKQTTYALTVYSAGILRVTATTGRISTSCEVEVTGGNQFAELNPARRLEELPTEGSPAYYFLNELPAGFGTTGTTKYTVDKAGSVSCDGVTSVSIADDKSVDHFYAKISNITGSGAIRVTATNDSNTPGDTSDDKTATFVLTVAYPASSKQKWDFYRMKHVSSDTKFGLYIGQIDDYNGDATQTAEPDPKPVTSHSATQRWSTDAATWSNSWTTDTKWEKVYRKGTEQPRWAYAYGMKGDNAFIVEETAGLQIETGQQGFYIDNPHQPTEFAYNHIGLHNNATVTIPRLKAGDYIALNLSRVIPNNGAILSATNVTDLAGTTVNHTFTITRSQIDYQNAGVPVTEISGDNVGARVIPGYYTFRAAADGDVSFTLSDEGFLDILSIEIYDGSYEPTMTNIVTDGTNVPPPATFLMDDGETEEVNLAICHLMRSTSVGPAEYVVVDKIGGLDATLENVEWVSDGGALYNKGRITVNDSYGKLLVRMNNYTADGRYLTGYTPTYTLTVGHKPHQQYPFTWDFTNISGGAVLGRSNNAASSIGTDYQTWTGLGYETYQLDTSTDAGSLYVPGATLVTAARSLGEKGSVNTLNSSGKGNDEFNGLGFAGQIAFKLAQQGETANDAPNEWTQGTEKSLLEYTINGENADFNAQLSGTTWTAVNLTAGDGKVFFGSPGKVMPPYKNAKDDTEGSVSITASSWVYRMDGGNTKYLLLMPQRPFQNGDVIHMTAYVPNTVNPQKSGFSFYVGATDAGSAALATVYFAANAVVDKEYTLDYTVKRGDGLAGRSQVYLCRAEKTYTVHLEKVSITCVDDSSAPASYERAITCMEETTITIPDLTAGQYVYIKSNAEPTVSSNLTKVTVSDDGTHGYDVAANTYKYTVTAAGNATLTFAANTKVYRIGVTNITKPLTRVGSGDAWATESRKTGVTQDNAIDYTQTGKFTVNDITANTVSATKYTTKNVTVKMNPLANAVPAETGVVLRLKLKYTTDDEKSEGVKMTDDEATTATTNAVADFAKAKGGNAVPLFAPPHSATILSAGAVGFGGTQGNLMMANLKGRKLTQERENGEIDNNGDDIDDSGVVDGAYTRFIFAYRYMKWQKVDDKPAQATTSDFVSSGDAPVFYRLHLYDSEEATALSTTESVLNTLGANKAYMLIRTTSVPDALWKNGVAPARPFIGIEGISDMEEYDPALGTGRSQGDGRTYNLRGQMMDDGSSLTPGVYIRNGKKVVVK